MAKRIMSFKAKNSMKLLLCLVITAALIFVVQPMLYKNQSATAEIVVAAGHIAKGSVISATDIKVKTVGSYGLPPKTITDKAGAIGQRAQTDLMPEDYLTENKIGEQRAAEDIGEILKSGKQLMSVSLGSAAAGVSSNLLKSDYVDIAVATQDPDTYEIIISKPQELKNIQVFAMENARGQNVELQRGESNENRDTIASNVTLIVTPSQAAELVKAEYSGKIHLIFVKRGGQDE